MRRNRVFLVLMGFAFLFGSEPGFGGQSLLDLGFDEVNTHYNYSRSMPGTSPFQRSAQAVVVGRSPIDPWRVSDDSVAESRRRLEAEERAKVDFAKDFKIRTLEERIRQTQVRSSLSSVLCFRSAKRTEKLNLSTAQISRLCSGAMTSLEPISCLISAREVPLFVEKEVTPDELIDLCAGAYSSTPNDGHVAETRGPVSCLMTALRDPRLADANLTAHELVQLCRGADFSIAPINCLSSALIDDVLKDSGIQRKEMITLCSNRAF